MCEANAYLLVDGSEEIFLENVDELNVDGDTVTLISIFGEQKSLIGRVRRYVNSDAKILLEPR